MSVAPHYAGNTQSSDSSASCTQIFSCKKKSSHYWDVMQHSLLVTDILEQPICPIFKGWVRSVVSQNVSNYQ